MNAHGDLEEQTASARRVAPSIDEFPRQPSRQTSNEVLQEEHVNSAASYREEYIEMGNMDAQGHQYCPARAGSKGESGSLRRALEKIHIFIISISLLIGMGFYVTSGTILRLGGPAAVVYSYGFLGILASMIMQGLEKMLRIWPIEGALVMFVESFVDKEVAMAVAILYWFTNCFTFAALSVVIGTLVRGLNITGSAEITVTVLSILWPILVNLTDIRVFRRIELTLGVLKLSMTLAVIIIMNFINSQIESPSQESPPEGTSSNEPLHSIFHHRENQIGGWFTSIMTSVLLASFSFIGIEAIAATAQEASPGFVTKSSPSNSHEQSNQGDRVTLRSEAANSLNHNPFQYAKWVPPLVTLIYVWGGWIASQNIRWDDPRLPSLSWTHPDTSATHSSTDSNSLFVIIADNRYSEDFMPRALTFLIIINVASTSSTALYVASRTIFGLAYNTVKPGGLPRRRTKIVDVLVRKSKFDVPYMAIIASAWLVWLPFTRYPSEDTFLIGYGIVTQSASVSCILVWGFLSLASFRFYFCYKKHHAAPIAGVPDRIKPIIKYDDHSVVPRFACSVPLERTGRFKPSQSLPCLACSSF
ncbi:amino acid permease-domain-containing protein [Stachybotrys elegans]|uniref:Amino acid permease-domain-containing protein n=1 Tax=Stachybotrys elegans TaxID=80388 RepID=A0A8K0WLF3_9HYPO|nr:amino acid permease-domain-containing protein [Stachybotrys elegans]